MQGGPDAPADDRAASAFIPTNLNSQARKAAAPPAVTPPPAVRMTPSPSRLPAGGFLRTQRMKIHHHQATDLPSLRSLRPFRLATGRDGRMHLAPCRPATRRARPRLAQKERRRPISGLVALPKSYFKPQGFEAEILEILRKVDADHPQKVQHPDCHAKQIPQHLSLSFSCTYPLPLREPRVRVYHIGFRGDKGRNRQFALRPAICSPSKKKADNRCRPPAEYVL